MQQSPLAIELTERLSIETAYQQLEECIHQLTMSTEQYERLCEYGLSMENIVSMSNEGESLSQEQSQMLATIVGHSSDEAFTLESAKDAIKKVWEAIKKAFKKAEEMLERLVSFFTGKGFTVVSDRVKKSEKRIFKSVDELEKVVAKEANKITIATLTDAALEDATNLYDIIKGAIKYNTSSSRTLEGAKEQAQTVEAAANAYKKKMASLEYSERIEPDDLKSKLKAGARQIDQMEDLAKLLKDMEKDRSKTLSRVDKAVDKGEIEDTEALKVVSPVLDNAIGRAMGVVFKMIKSMDDEYRKIEKQLNDQTA